MLIVRLRNERGIRTVLFVLGKGVDISSKSFHDCEILFES